MTKSNKILKKITDIEVLRSKIFLQTIFQGYQCCWFYHPLNTTNFWLHSIGTFVAKVKFYHHEFSLPVNTYKMPLKIDRVLEFLSLLKMSNLISKNNFLRKIYSLLDRKKFHINIVINK